jgi:hypothetical protein
MLLLLFCKKGPPAGFVSAAKKTGRESLTAFSPCAFKVEDAGE